jgi:hypothetical protein
MNSADLSAVSTKDLHVELARRDGVYEIVRLGVEDSLYYVIVTPEGEREGAINGPTIVMVNGD